MRDCKNSLRATATVFANYRHRTSQRHESVLYAEGALFVFPLTIYAMHCKGSLKEGVLGEQCQSRRQDTESVGRDYD